ncbi:hypothetical protein F5J12DRAFT_783940 [Pisolithus orientalis]|uniref:uncharacterized protein n=1 Tax=Pisolithus orientalis TaxID=936130 RepID=UPI002225AA33|nr:uncharacterized protein F5J12DRAFT_783940 [Pisolithus orientalis]KAI6002489.1 hypothetical protein F5J12DRAFT_783940 [Pisolithus orientalis]
MDIAASYQKKFTRRILFEGAHCVEAEQLEGIRASDPEISANPSKGTLIHQKPNSTTNDGCSERGKTASDDGGERNEYAEKETEGICACGPEIFTRLSESASNHENRRISTTAARNLTKEASPERAMQGGWTAGNARGTALGCARYDERTSRAGRRAVRTAMAGTINTKLREVIENS